MGRSTFIVVFIVLLGFIAAIVPDSPKSGLILGVIPQDSVELKKHSVYVCTGHFFEWCKEPSICNYCLEPLEKKTLWEYYILLKADNCPEFFDENYTHFLEN